MISSRIETLLIQKHTVFLMSRNVQGMISDRNETPLVKKHTPYEQECAGDDQRQGRSSVDTETHFL